MSTRQDNMYLSYFILITGILATGLADLTSRPVTIRKCGNNQTICKVTEVRIDPCRNIRKCELKKGSTAAISFDFTPNFAATSLKTNVYWDSGVFPLPFAGFGSNNGCDYTGCPTEVGRPQTLNYNMTVSALLPSGTFPIKWEVWNEEETTQTCCFKTTVVLEW